MVKKIVELLFVFALASILMAQCLDAGAETDRTDVGEVENPTEDDQDYEKNMSGLEKAGYVSDTNKSNAPYVPDITTILTRKDLKFSGARTVYEALSMVPGLKLDMYSFGVKKIVVRGLTQTYGFSNMKLLLNNAPMNNAFIGTNPGFYDIPVEIVDRIEILRGSGAVQYGENSGSGVINVITRKDGTRVFGRLGEFNTYDGGATFTHPVKEDEKGNKELDADRDFHISMNLAGWKTDGADVNAGPDSKGNMGSTNEAHRNWSGIVEARYKNFTILGQFLSSEFGDYFGYGATLPESGADQMIQSYDTTMIETRATKEFKNSIQAELKIGFSQYKQDWLVKPFSFYKESGGDVYVFDDVSEDSYYKERRLYGEFTLQGKIWGKHSWIVGMSYEDINVIDAWISKDKKLKEELEKLEKEAEELKMDYPSPRAFYGDRNRKIVGLFAEGELELSDRFTLKPGLRYDYYNDLKAKWTPRLSVFYEPKGKYTLKAQYVEGFRTPTFFKEYGWGTQFQVEEPQDSDHETIRTLDLGFRWDFEETLFGVTLFYSEIQDLQAYKWYKSGVNHPANLDTIEKAEMKGVELEFDQELTKSMGFNTNISYVDAKYLDPDDEHLFEGHSIHGKQMQGVANWMANASLHYEIGGEKGSLILRYSFVGERHRWYTDARKNLDKYQTVDFILNINRFCGTGWTLRAGVKNLFDDDVAYPSFQEALYKNDLPRPGRRWWMQASYEFEPHRFFD